MTIKIVGYCYTLLVKDYNILKIVFSILTSYFIFDTFYTWLVRQPTYTSLEKRSITGDDFPDIMVCPQPTIDKNVLQSKGYPGNDAYFKGLIKPSAVREENKSEVTWAGNGSEDILKVYHDISNLKSTNECGEIQFNFDGVTLNKTFTRSLSPYHMCCKITPPKMFQSSPLEYLAIKFMENNTHINSYKVFLADQFATSILDQYSTIMLGDKIVTTPEDGFNHFKVKMLEDVRLQADPNYPCMNYNERGEYSKCVENEMVEENLKYLNCTPPWMTDKRNLWCKGTYSFDSKTSTLNFILHLFKIGGIVEKPKECIVPCTGKTYLVKHMGDRHYDKANEYGVSLWFENEVAVTKASWKTNAETIISAIGGFIGIGKEFLWLTILLISSVGALLSYLKLRKDK